MKRVVYMFLMLTLLYSCEEVIDVDLNTADPHLVAEGFMDLSMPCRVQLSYTRNYFDVEDPVYFEDAILELSDDIGNKEILSYQGDGFYSGMMMGEAGRNYSLSFEHEGENYVANTELFAPVDIRDVTWEESIFQRPPAPGEEPDTSYTMSMTFTDENPGLNYFLINVNEHESPVQGFYLTISDEYTNEEGEVEFPLMMFSFELGDTASIAIYSIDEGTYGFMNAMNDLLGVGMSMGTQPYNPSSNFGDDVLGYFMARSRVDTTVILH